MNTTGSRNAVAATTTEMDIFAEEALWTGSSMSSSASPTADASASVEPSRASSKFDPFDPLAVVDTTANNIKSNCSSSSSSSTSSGGLDLLGQIEGWGAQNRCATSNTEESSAHLLHESNKEAMTNVKVMSTPTNAIELTDDLIQMTHAQVEAVATAS